MSYLKILIVEDELIIAEDMKGMLQDLEYEVIGIGSDSSEAEQILAHDTPDIALIDIHLRRNDDGISLAHSIKRRFNIPIIFITSYSDKTTVEHAKLVNPEGYIVKPFEKDDLYTSIEIAISNFAKNQSISAISEKEDSYNTIIRDSIFIRKDYMLIKIKFDDLLWIKSELNYLELHCKDNKHLVRSTMKEFVDKLPSSTFIQVHKSYCINTKYITAIDHCNIWLKDVQLPIGRSYHEAIEKKLHLEI
jgi:two-component system response regulator LytT